MDATEVALGRLGVADRATEAPPEARSGLRHTVGITDARIPMFVIAEVGDAIFDSLCPGIRFTAEDDALYTAAAYAALEASGYADLVEAVDAMLTASQPQHSAGRAVYIEEAQEKARITLAKARGEA